MNRRLFLSLSSGILGSIALSKQLAANPGIAEAESASLDHQIGQMLIMGFRGNDVASPGTKAIVSWLREGLIGGVIFFEPNLPSPEVARRFTGLFRGAADTQKPLLSVDQEGGSISRLRADRGFVPLPSAAEIATWGPEEARLAYNRTAEELHDLGFNVNFAPVVDLNLNPNSYIISGLGRAFSSDPHVVVEYAEAFIWAHHRNRVLTAIKHFPGHGSTAADSHLTLPDITASWRPEELLPFEQLIRMRVVDMVMVAHLVDANLTEPGRPASLSRRAVEGLLRNKLGYQGVVVSDDMQMGALRQTFDPDECILLGIQAGLDLFIYSNREHPDREMPERFHRVVRSAIENGILHPTRIQQSYARICELKRKI
jgi:beta-N-acetylhexosaminidase